MDPTHRDALHMIAARTLTERTVITPASYDGPSPEAEEALVAEYRMMYGPLLLRLGTRMYDMRAECN